MEFFGRGQGNELPECDSLQARWARFTCRPCVITVEDVFGAAIGKLHLIVIPYNR